MVFDIEIHTIGKEEAKTGKRVWSVVNNKTDCVQQLSVHLLEDEVYLYFGQVLVQSF